MSYQNSSTFLFFHKLKWMHNYSEFKLIISNFHILRFRKLIFQYRNELWVDFIYEKFYFLCSFSYVFLRNTSKFNHIFVPSIDFFKLFCWKNKSSCCHLAWFESKESRFQKCNFKKILGIEKNFIIVDSLSYSPISLQKSVGRRRSHLKIQFLKNMFFHIKDLVAFEFIFADSQEVSKLRWIYLFVLCRNQQSCHADEVQLGVFYLFQRQIFIDNILSYVQAFWSETEFSMHINNPFKKEGSLCIFDFSLDFLKVIWWVDFMNFFLLKHTLENVLRKFRNWLRVSIL